MISVHFITSYYFARESGGEVLRWARLSVCVCLSVCPPGYFRAFMWFPCFGTGSNGDAYCWVAKLSSFIKRFTAWTQMANACIASNRVEQ